LLLLGRRWAARVSHVLILLIRSDQLADDEAPPHVDLFLASDMTDRQVSVMSVAVMSCTAVWIQVCSLALQP
jgi:hypothetical protein